ncbi:TatD family hydrolase [Candidatus Saccharibacteria bacterium]|nr:TatD family hydrolase [Candidatus Saccharibacteria bacterium]
MDTHCHIHEIDQPLTPVYDKWHSDGVARTGESVLRSAQAAGVRKLIVIGTTLEDSEQAVRFAQSHDGVWASIGLHPHEAKKYTTPQKHNFRGLSSESSAVSGGVQVLPEVMCRFRELVREPKVVAVGECGLDYFYGHSARDEQAAILRFQIELALEHDLPLSFHVRGVPGYPDRDAFADFWPIFESYRDISGVLHSFTDTTANMERAVSHGLYIGTNGIATFTRDEAQLVTYRTIPQHKLLLETDAPFLTPNPFRGRVCLPEHVVLSAEFLANLRGESLSELARVTTANARKLFSI